MDKPGEILQAARKLFHRFGLKKVSVEDIAREAGVSKVTVYKYFGNKTGLFNEVVGIEADRMFRDIQAGVAEATTVTAKLKAHLMIKIKRIQELVDFYRVTLETMSEHWSRIAEISESFMEKEKVIVTEILEFGNKNGDLKVPQVPMTAQVMVISLKSLEFSWLVDRPGVDLETYVDLLLDIMLNGLKSRQERSPS